mmetsp:Transcript_42494/g.108772  ORF Transcript_42494/g.108772 Transcript_42494/m.108772 type:complete len:219 (-) Transcript_42494:30-686(-)
MSTSSSLSSRRLTSVSSVLMRESADVKSRVSRYRFARRASIRCRRKFRFSCFAHCTCSLHTSSCSAVELGTRAMVSMIARTILAVLALAMEAKPGRSSVSSPATACALPCAAYASASFVIARSLSFTASGSAPLRSLPSAAPRSTARPALSPGLPASLASASVSEASKATRSAMMCGASGSVARRVGRATGEGGDRTLVVSQAALGCPLNLLPRLLLQ